MKRNYLYILMAMFGMLFAGCQKDLEGMLTASIEGYEGGEEKVYINHNNEDGLYYACWYDGDTVIVNGMECRIRLQGDNNHALVEGIDISELDTINAMYPATIENKVVWKGEQTYREMAMPNGTKAQVVEAPMVATAVKDEAGNANLVFKNVGGLVKVTVPRATKTKVRRIEVKNVNDGMLWGEASYGWNEHGEPTMGALSGGSKSVRMVFSSEYGSANVEKVYYIAVPQVSGVKLEVTVVYEETSGNNKAYKVWTKTTNNAGGVTVGRNQLLAVPSVDFAATNNISDYTLSGSGDSENDPFLISTLLDWDAFVNGCNASNSTFTEGKFFKQMVDIEIESPETYVGVKFKNGTYDGGDHKIVNGTATQKARKGVFDVIRGNVTIKNLNVETQMDVYDSWVGGLVNTAQGDDGMVKISNCSVRGELIGRDNNPNTIYNNMGGFIGYNSHGNVRMYNCVNYAQISANGMHINNVGGFVGYADGQSSIKFTILDRCINYGSIDGPYSVGGFVGEAAYKESLKIFNCVNHGEVSSLYTSNYGGMVGYTYESYKLEICNSYSTMASSHALLGGSRIISTSDHVKFDNVYIYSDTDWENVKIEKTPSTYLGTRTFYYHAYIPNRNNLKEGIEFYDASNLPVLLNNLNNNALNVTLPNGYSKEPWIMKNGKPGFAFED